MATDKKLSGPKPETTTSSSAPVQTSGEQEVQQAVDQATAQGFVGEKVDPEPNSTYTAPRG